MNGGKLQVLTPRHSTPYLVSLLVLEFGLPTSSRPPTTPCIADRKPPRHNTQFGHPLPPSKKRRRLSFQFVLHRRTIVMNRTCIFGRFRFMARSHTVCRIPTSLARSYYIPPHYRMVGTVFLSWRFLVFSNGIGPRFCTSVNLRLPTTSLSAFENSHRSSVEVVESVGSSIVAS